MKLFKGECIATMRKELKDKSVNLIICDLPYGTTDCEWDSVIDNYSLFSEYERILTDNGTILLFGSEPFSTTLKHDGFKLYKYDLYWLKDNQTGFAHSKNMPLKNIELISVFSKGIIQHDNLTDNRMTYNPQGLIKLDKPNVYNGTRPDESVFGKRKSHSTAVVQEYTNYPRLTLEFKSVKNRLHSTQKPVALYEYLINTYSNPGEVILDNCAGSGTLGAAGINIPDREYIMIELESKYQDIIIKRLPDIEVFEGSMENIKPKSKPKPEFDRELIIKIAKESKDQYIMQREFTKNGIDIKPLYKKFNTKKNPRFLWTKLKEL